MFVPTRKDHVKEFGAGLGGRFRETRRTKNRCFSARTSSATAPPPSSPGTSEGAEEEEEEHGATSDQGGDGRKVYAKDDTVANAVVARKTSAPRAGVAATELERVIEKMEEFELRRRRSSDLREDFDDGGLGIAG